MMTITKLHTLFRFHTGSIKSPEPEEEGAVWDLFRFHTGSIKSNTLRS